MSRFAATSHRFAAPTLGAVSSTTLTPPIAEIAPQAIPADVRPVGRSAPEPVRIGDRARFRILCASHGVIDVFPIFFSTLAWALRERLSLTSWQFTCIFMMTPIFSGLTQPLFAWLTDKHNTRVCGPIGLALGALCIASIGFAQNFWQLAVLQAFGVMATGMYHPIGTALAGQIGTRFLRNGRGQAIGIFIASGMLGQSLGPRIAAGINSINGGTGMPWLIVLIPPALVMAAILHAFTRKMSHRHGNHHEMRAAFSHAESRRRWGVIAVLTSQNALRFTTNVGMFVMFNVWAKSKLLTTEFATDAARAAHASNLTGLLSSALTVGMGITVILGGRLVKPGRERMPLFWCSILGAIGTASIGFLGDWCVGYTGSTAWWALFPMYLAGVVSSMGFFATFPMATSLAQRLQPGHTGLVTSLMMGIGWGISAVAAPLAQVFFGGVSMDHAPELATSRINMGFYGFAALLLVAGALTLFLPRDLVKKAAEHH